MADSNAVNIFSEKTNVSGRTVLDNITVADDVLSNVKVSQSLPETPDTLLDKTATNSKERIANRVKAYTKKRPVVVKTSLDGEIRVLTASREVDLNGEPIPELPILDIDNRAIEAVRETVGSRVVLDKFRAFSTKEEDVETVKTQISWALSSKDLDVISNQANIDAIYDEINGFGPLSILFEVPLITDIVVSAWDRVAVEYKGITYQARNIKFKSPKHYSNMVEHMVGLLNQKISANTPILNMALPDGSRVNIESDSVVEKVDTNGDEDASNFFLTIRRFGSTRFHLTDLVKNGTMSAEMAEYLTSVMRARGNLLLIGSTSSGKTATLEALITEKNPNEFIITCEDTRELKLPPKMNVRYMHTRTGADSNNVTIRDLVKESLRMRPDSIVIGETRDATAYDILLAMNSGHDGSCTTLHANSGQDGLDKFESYSRMAEDAPIDVLRQWIAESIDVVCFLQKTPEGRRLMMTIEELVGYDNEKRTYITRSFSEAVKVSLPGEEPRYEFYLNPDYYTTDSLKYKFRRYEMSYVENPAGGNDSKTMQRSRFSADARLKHAEQEKQKRLMLLKQQERTRKITERKDIKRRENEKRKRIGALSQAYKKKTRKIERAENRQQTAAELSRQKKETQKVKKMLQNQLHQKRVLERSLQIKEEAILLKQLRKEFARSVKEKEAFYRGSTGSFSEARVIAVNKTYPILVNIIKNTSSISAHQKDDIILMVRMQRDLYRNNGDFDIIIEKYGLSLKKALYYLGKVEPQKVGQYYRHLKNETGA